MLSSSTWRSWRKRIGSCSQHTNFAINRKHWHEVSLPSYLMLSL
uniref:Uncharacterized protein n=1 Tax=Arundo donax TaxID=35708 RepID=A0A0A9ACF8_ARUDO